MAKYITAPLTKEQARSLRAGESVYLSGSVYTARDAAHKRLCELVEQGKPLPFPIEGAVIYYVGPSPRGPDRRSAPPVPPPATAWTPMPPRCCAWESWA